MIVKERDFPVRLFKLAALNRRLPVHHNKKGLIEKQVGNLRAGYIGETSIDYYLQFLPQEYHILHNLRLRDMYGHFQMDTLVITQRFILILEVKNISGIILFDEIGQVIRQQNQYEENFGNPAAQVNLQHTRLRNWLGKHNLPLIPIKKFIIYANPNAIIKNISKEKRLKDMIIRKELLPQKIEGIAKKHTEEMLILPQFEKLSQTLTESHSKEVIDVFKIYNLNYSDCLKGVFCPECNGLPMQRINAKWLCLNCKIESRRAHIPSLHDYYFLLGEEITNRQARNFLRLNSPYVTQNLLKKMEFEEVGNNKGRKYIMNPPKIRPELELDFYLK